MITPLLKKRLLNNLILIVSFIILMLLIHSYSSNSDTKKLNTITQLDKNRIHFISVHIPEKHDIELIRTPNNQWQLIKPFPIEANHTLANMLLNLANSQSDTRYPISGLDLAGFQLNRPVAIVKLGDAEFRFGDKDPIDNKRYLLYNGTLYLIEDKLFPIISSGIGGFVSPKLIPSNQNIKRIELEKFSIYQNNTHNWQIMPAAPEIATEQLEAWINRWQQQQTVYLQHNPQNELNFQSELKVTLQNEEKIEYQIVMQNKMLRLFRPDYKLLYHMDEATLVKLISHP